MELRLRAMSGYGRDKALTSLLSQVTSEVRPHMAVEKVASSFFFLFPSLFFFPKELNTGITGGRTSSLLSCIRDPPLVGW